MNQALAMAITLCAAQRGLAQESIDPTKDSPTPDRIAALVAEMPHVRVDRDSRIVEFDGFVPIDAHIADAPNLYLEVMVCTPDVRAHESLVASRASPTHIHAALLLIGLAPGRTGSWTWDGEATTRVAPEGPRVEVRFLWTDEQGNAHDDLACDWIVSRVTGARLTDCIPAGEPRWVFAGSRMVSRGGREWYAAEAEGTIVGLHTFTTETVAWRGVLSPSAEIEDPEWIADPERVPTLNTPVVVQIRALDVAAPEARE